MERERESMGGYDGKRTREYGRVRWKENERVWEGTVERERESMGEYGGKRMRGGIGRKTERVKRKKNEAGRE